MVDYGNQWMQPWLLRPTMVRYHCWPCWPKCRYKYVMEWNIYENTDAQCLFNYGKRRILNDARTFRTNGVWQVKKITHFTMSKVVWLHKLICALLSGSCHLEALRCIKWIIDPDFSQPKLVLISPTSLSRNCQPRDFIRGPQDQSDQERRYAATRTDIILVKG